MGRRSLVAAVLGLGLLALGAVGYWQWSATRLESVIAEWSARQRARGYAVDYRGPDVDGFPMRLQARIEAPSVTAPAGWSWSGPPISGEAALWDPFTIDFDAHGRHQVADPDAPGVTEITLAEATARVTLQSDGRVEQATAALRDATAVLPHLGTLTVERLIARLGPLQPANGERLQALDLAAEAERLRLPDGLATPLGPEVARVEIDARLNGEIASGTPRAALERWRDAGGNLDVERLTLTWGELVLEADGTLALDAALRPLGAFAARIRGLSAALDAFARRDLIDRGQVLAAKLALLALAGGRDADGNPVVEVPITLQDGLLYLGPLPLAQLSPVL